MLSWFDAAILGLVEGLTEFIPVSSTGHLILVNRWLGHSGAGADAFEIVIQLGALFACILYYRVLLIGMVRGIVAGEAAARRLASSIMSAFVPTAVVGFFLHKRIEALFFGPRSVAGALMTGGVAMIVIERLVRARKQVQLDDLADVTPMRGFVVGIAQCAALIPGTSRSMASMIGGMLTGLSTRVAADFAFLVGIPTLGAACLFKLVKARHTLLAEVGAGPLGLGLLISFVVGWAVIAVFLRALRKTGLLPFGVYRIFVGAIVLALIVP